MSSILVLKKKSICVININNLKVYSLYYDKFLWRRISEISFFIFFNGNLSFPSQITITVMMMTTTISMIGTTLPTNNSRLLVIQTTPFQLPRLTSLKWEHQPSWYTHLRWVNKWNYHHAILMFTQKSLNNCWIAYQLRVSCLPCETLLQRGVLELAVFNISRGIEFWITDSC